MYLLKMILKRLFLSVFAELAVDGLEKAVNVLITVACLEMVESVLFCGDGLVMVELLLLCGDGPVMVDLLFNCFCTGRWNGLVKMLLPSSGPNCLPQLGSVSRTLHGLLSDTTSTVGVQADTWA